ncbi:MAG: hypothetical protein N2654_07900 [Deltaproteobacteria bacterium]|nr:hypothetical protein [Deltaproteobacteria bacterium]
MLDDFVFDSRGNLLISHFKMTKSGVYYLSGSDHTNEEVFVENLSTPNGVCLSLNGQVVWVSKNSMNTVLRIAPSLINDIAVPKIVVVFRSNGTVRLDSNKVDPLRNLYKTIFGKGRLVVINSKLLSIANLLIPSREKRNHPRTNNLAITFWNKKTRCLGLRRERCIGFLVKKYVGKRLGLYYDRNTE